MRKPQQDKTTASILFSKGICFFLFYVCLVGTLSAQQADSLQNKTISKNSDKGSIKPIQKISGCITGKYYVSNDADFVYSSSEGEDHTATISGRIYIYNANLLYISNDSGSLSGRNEIPKKKHNISLAKSTPKIKNSTKKKVATVSSYQRKFSAGKDSSHFAYSKTSQFAAVFAPSSSLKKWLADDFDIKQVETQFYIQISKKRDHYNEGVYSLEWYNKGSGRAPPFYS